MNEYKRLAKECAEIIGRMSGINAHTGAGPNTRNLKAKALNLAKAMNATHHEFAELIHGQATQLITKNGVINAFCFGQIRAYIEVIHLQVLRANGKKIFISHSSENADIVGWFVDHILQLGIGIDVKDIFCTSIEDMKIKNGEDIRKHIHDNIKSADFSYLFLSDEYKDSEICINEMGAVWAYDSNVRYYTLPNFQFTEIGWLCDPKSAEVLCNSSTLDSIQRELRDFYTLEDKGATWSRQREIFIAQFNNL